MKKILITGGNGFIARNLQEQLSLDFDITSCTRSDLDLLNHSTVKQFLQSHSFDTIIHTATYDAAPIHSFKDPKKVLHNNTKMFFNLVTLKDESTKLIYFGSGAEFDRQHWVPKMKESYFNQHIPSDPYGFSKYIMNEYTQKSSTIYNLRLFGVFGKYDDWRTRFISNTCFHTLSALPITIHYNRSLDYIYIDDLVKITSHFIKHNPHHSTYNICTGNPISSKAIANEIVSLSDTPIPITLRNTIPEYSGDNTRLLPELPSSFKFTPFRTAIKELYNYHNINGFE